MLEEGEIKRQTRKDLCSDEIIKEMMRWPDTEKIIQMAVAPLEEIPHYHWSRGGGGGRPRGVHEETKGRLFEGAGVRRTGLGEMWALTLSLMLPVGILGVSLAFLESYEMLTFSFPSSLFFAHYLLL